MLSPPTNIEKTENTRITQTSKTYKNHKVKTRGVGNTNKTLKTHKNNKEKCTPKSANDIGGGGWVWGRAGKHDRMPRLLAMRRPWVHERYRVVLWFPSMRGLHSKLWGKYVRIACKQANSFQHLGAAISRHVFASGRTAESRRVVCVRSCSARNASSIALVGFVLWGKEVSLIIQRIQTKGGN